MGNNTKVYHLGKDYFVSWTPSKATLNGRDYESYEIEPYPSGTKCQVQFIIPAGETMNVYMDMLNTAGQYKDGCVDGDYVKFFVDGGEMKSRKFCGHVDDLED